jgi:hypothetical protein
VVQLLAVGQEPAAARAARATGPPGPPVLGPVKMAVTGPFARNPFASAANTSPTNASPAGLSASETSPLPDPAAAVPVSTSSIVLPFTNPVYVNAPKLAIVSVPVTRPVSSWVRVSKVAVRGSMPGVVPPRPPAGNGPGGDSSMRPVRPD